MSDYIVRIVPAKKTRRDGRAQWYDNVAEYVGTYRADSAESAVRMAQADSYIRSLPTKGVVTAQPA